MKLALLGFLFLLLNSSIAQVVLDQDGNPLVSGGDYYMMMGLISPGPGGVSLATGNNMTCPVDVNIVFCCRTCIEPQNCLGEAVRLNPLAKIGIIKTNLRLSITFAKTPSCAQSPEWILVKEEGAWLVGIGGPEDNPGKEILTGFFIIERSGAVGLPGYTLKFCPKHLPQICGYLGLHTDANRNTRLALTYSTPHVVYFLKVDEGRYAI
ncbi:hypothetical protein QN277_005915 [Acacia crassicarpa]|uniref:Uncharacterized protein n=1 Tax=Acacia crassicarpa TaxID=499986 RepID=A0AAE1MBQ3_9FABA|nr:hypothetical protein QN277_005915 [Acacia crassicarpa]